MSSRSASIKTYGACSPICDNLPAPWNLSSGISDWFNDNQKRFKSCVPL